MLNSLQKTPFVSIIIPVYNNSKGLNTTLTAIANQKYAPDMFETIVVDNGSIDNPKSTAKQFNTIFIKEDYHLGSPYSARNRGLEIAKGNIVVLLDATCAPVEGWLKYGLDKMSEGYDLVGGNVIFDINENSGIGEIYDSLINIRMKESITERNIAKTTNLFIRKELFDILGAFPEGLRSGGDVRWTGKAVKKGFKLAFSEDAKAFISPRPLLPLLRKQWRVAKGQPAIWIELGIFYSELVKLLFFFIPPNPIRFYSKLRIEPDFYREKSVRLYCVAYLTRLIMRAGNLVGWGKLITESHWNKFKRDKHADL